MKEEECDSYGKRPAGPTIRGERGRLRAVAYRMLGSVNEAEDAVQEAWLRLSRSDANSIESIEAWLTTVAYVSVSSCFTASLHRAAGLPDRTSRGISSFHRGTSIRPSAVAFREVIGRLTQCGVGGRRLVAV